MDRGFVEPCVWVTGIGLDNLVKVSEGSQLKFEVVFGETTCGKGLRTSEPREGEEG